jgi:hypothetical protein
MKRSFQLLLIANIYLIFLISSQTCKALSVKRNTWEELVLFSDFVGIVECEKAGGIVAEYKIIEVLKGTERKKNLIKIKIPPCGWGPTFPVALCGEKYFVTANKYKEPDRKRNISFDDAVPSWWRNIEPDYCLPLLQGIIPLSKNNKCFFNSPYKSLNSFKTAVHNLYKQYKDQKENTLLQVYINKYFMPFGRLNDYFSRSKSKEAKKELLSILQKIKNSNSVSFKVNSLLKLAVINKNIAADVYAVLSKGGGPKTLDALNDYLKTMMNEEKIKIEKVCKTINNRMQPEKNTDTQVAYRTNERISQKKLSEFRKDLIERKEPYRFFEAFDKLTEHDPEFICNYLLTWKKPDNNAQVKNDRGYVLGSFFGIKCGNNKIEYLQKLLGAQDPFIKVAAAVYLDLEKSELGIKHLRELQRIEGTAGSWAALSLVRRGEVSAMPYALKLLTAYDGPDFMEKVTLSVLGKRLKILISNSCKASNIPMPDLPYVHLHREYPKNELESHKAYQQKRHKEILDWWHTNKLSLKIYDPWFESLAKQKID